MSINYSYFFNSFRLNFDIGSLKIVISYIIISIEMVTINVQTNSNDRKFLKIPDSI